MQARQTLALSRKVTKKYLERFGQLFRDCPEGEQFQLDGITQTCH
jgi:hypothetical protein